MGIVGPTASGKSAVAHRVACRLGDVEIVTVDSMQVYRGMDIGTAKPDAAMRREVAYHLLDVAEPSEEFSLRAFQAEATRAVADIEAGGNRPLLVGGTGLYLRSIIDELDIPGRYPQVRARLEQEADADLAALHARLCEVDPVAAARMDPANRRRIIRALEVCEGADRPFSSFGEGLETYPPTDWDVVVLRVDTDVANEAIRIRYTEQLAAGFLDEVRGLLAARRPLGRTASQALGYRQLAAHLRGESTLDDAVDAAVAATRRFARRQRSWFRRDPRLAPFDVVDPADQGALVDALTDRWRRADRPGRWQPEGDMGDWG